MARFKNWLSNQQPRTDLIGKFARAAMDDREFPDENNPTLLSDYLAARGANKKLLKTLQEAFSEFTAFQVAMRENPAPEKKPAKRRAAVKPVNNKPALAAKVKEIKVEEHVPEAQPAEANLPATATQNSTTEPAPTKRRGRPRKEITATTETALPKTPAKRGRKPNSASQLPTHLTGQKKLLQEAAQVLDAQFGAGFAEAHPLQVIDFTKTLAAANQNNLVKNFINTVAEAMARFTRK